jgi:hypothetical protein
MFSYWPSMPVQLMYFAMMVCLMFVGVVALWIVNLIRRRKSGAKAPMARAKANRLDTASSDIAHHHAIQAHQLAVQTQQAEVNRQIIQGTVNAAPPPPTQPPL